MSEEQEQTAIIEESEEIELSGNDRETNAIQNLINNTSKIKKSKSHVHVITLAGTDFAGVANGITTLATADLPAIANGLTTDGKIWQSMIGLPQVNNTEITHIIAVKSNELDDEEQDNSIQNVNSNPSTESLAAMLMSPSSQNLPPDTPAWALRLKDCEAIGDSFRGWVQSEVELDLLLTYHKQQTQSFWGTRQSPSPSRGSTRLMWKSQYVPFDGIPFINSGSRAIVMECQYGPRRKGNPTRKQGEQGVKMDFKQTCPARIYIKKARKFPEYTVDTTLDKKNLRLVMDRAFQELKQKNLSIIGEERFYVQLPTYKAHEFHYEQNGIDVAATVSIQPESSTRLHPQVQQKIAELVARGETRVYAIRKQLRKFVERELFDSPDLIPERHNLSYFPTVHDLQNHIYQAFQELEAGGFTVQTQTLQMQSEGDISSDHAASNEDAIIWQPSITDEAPHPETMTVTLTQNPEQGEGHVISRIETHLSDGTTQITQLSSETAQLLSKLHPSVFQQASFIQLQDTQQTAVVMEAHITADGIVDSVPVVFAPVDPQVEELQLVKNDVDITEEIEGSIPVVFSKDDNQSQEIHIVKNDGQIECMEDMITVAMAPENDYHT